MVSGTYLALPLGGADEADAAATNSLYLTMDISAISGLDFIAGQSVTVGTGRG